MVVVVVSLSLLLLSLLLLLLLLLVLLLLLLLMIRHFLFQYGVVGAFWYAAGGAVQLFLFSIVAAELRIKAPGAKTFLQVRNR